MRGIFINMNESEHHTTYFLLLVREFNVSYQIWHNLQKYNKPVTHQPCFPSVAVRYVEVPF